VLKGSAFVWSKGDLIGRGSLGSVWKALDQRTGQLMAVKEVLLDALNSDDDRFRASLQNEVSLCEDLRHRNVVSYLGNDYIGGHLYIYLEFMAGGSIAQVLSQFGPLDEVLSARYTRDVVAGLEYLHSRDPPVLHRDVKGANILVGSCGTAKLSDFGCSRRSVGAHTMDGAATTLRGSVPWMAPEVMNQSGYGRKADIWSLGCVVIEMRTGKPPWGHFENQLAAMVKIAMSTETPPLPASLSDHCRSFATLCTRRAPEERADAATLLHHGFLTGLIPSATDAS
jgi:mitogen-activated protein kinase kinase kinase 3